MRPAPCSFGESLPERFFECAETDLKEADLLIIFGTSLKVELLASLGAHCLPPLTYSHLTTAPHVSPPLPSLPQVQPFASLVGLVRDDVPRLLINREQAHQIAASLPFCASLPSCASLRAWREDPLTQTHPHLPNPSHPSHPSSVPPLPLPPPPHWQVGTDEQPIIKHLGFIDDRALDFSEGWQYRDACYLGDCDTAVAHLAELLDEAHAATQAAAAAGLAAAVLTAAAARAEEEDEVARNEGEDEPRSIGGGWAQALRSRLAAQPPPQPRMPPPDQLEPVERASDSRASVSPGPEAAMSDDAAVAGGVAGTGTMAAGTMAGSAAAVMGEMASAAGAPGTSAESAPTQPPPAPLPSPALASAGPALPPVQVGLPGAAPPSAASSAASSSSSSASASALASSAGAPPNLMPQASPDVVTSPEHKARRVE